MTTQQKDELRQYVLTVVPDIKEDALEAIVNYHTPVNNGLREALKKIANFPVTHDYELSILKIKRLACAALSAPSDDGWVE